MRLASKNQVITLLGDKALSFAQYCLTDDGAPVKFLFDNTDTFDLDLPLIQDLVTRLLAGNVIDQATASRFDAFGQDMPTPVVAPLVLMRSWRVLMPADVETWRLQYAPQCQVVSGVKPLSGWLYVTGPTCTDPAAEEI